MAEIEQLKIDEPTGTPIARILELYLQKRETITEKEGFAILKMLEMLTRPVMVMSPYRAFEAGAGIRS